MVSPNTFPAPSTGGWDGFLNAIVNGTNSIITTARGGTNTPVDPAYNAPLYQHAGGHGDSLLMIGLVVVVAVLLLK